MRAVIIASGTVYDYGYFKQCINKDDLVICADGGYNHAVKMGIDIEVVIGDMDSIEYVPKDVKILRYPTKKDMTDMELAVDYARNLGCKKFLIIGATGNRMDHTLTNVMMLKNFLDRDEYAEILDENNRIMITNSEIRLDGHKGLPISLIPLTDCSGITTENLEYPLRDEELYLGGSRGVSNVMCGNTAAIKVRQGILLIIIYRR